MAELFGIDPLQELTHYRDMFRQLVESGFVAPRDLLPSAVATMILPIDLIDDGPELIVQTDLPGLKPEEVSISVVGSSLTIKATIPQRADFPAASYLRRERRAGVVSRTIALPVAVDADKAEAKFSQGVLTLTLPKSEAVRPRTIRVVGE